jgi:ribonuclease HI
VSAFQAHIDGGARGNPGPAGWGAVIRSEDGAILALLVQQMRGVYKVKNDGLKPLHARARLVAQQIGRVDYEHVRREFNKDADRLANEAMDAAASP